MVARAVGLNVAAFLPMEWLSEFSCDESVRKVNATDDGDSEGTGARRGGLRSLVLLADDDVGASAPAHAIASALHETLYSRLCRS